MDGKFSKKSNWKYSNFKMKGSGPLKDIRVIDLSRVVAGNMTSLQLADFGAEVIKVEPLPDGDPLRTWKQGGESTFWKVYSRNKKSIGLDFRSLDFKEIIRHLIESADVMIENSVKTQSTYIRTRKRKPDCKIRTHLCTHL